MTIDEILVSTLSPIVPELEPNRYSGTATEYLVWNYNILPSVLRTADPTRPGTLSRFTGSFLTR